MISDVQAPVRMNARARRAAPVRWLCGALVLAGLATSSPAAAQVAITTHHYDVGRTGWNSHETALTYQTVAPTGTATFGLLRNVVLDAQVDAQPLVVPNVSIVGDPNAGKHDVVFVATEANTLYAIDPTRGTVLNSRNFGTAVAMPLGCTNNASTVGINSTPVIDIATNSLYIVSYTQAAAGPTYMLHRLALADFSDIVPPQIVAASLPLANGIAFPFNATYQRLRAALLLNNGAIYAGFASFCDLSASKSRGWLLGWQADTLAPLPVNSRPGTIVSVLTDRQPRDRHSFFLSSIWMSGSGPAADAAGKVFFVTGNSDISGTTYNGHTNIQESVVKFDPLKNRIVSLFTPANVGTLDQTDSDFGSGGVILLPVSPVGLPSHLAAAAGKDGWLFLMNSDALGGYNGPAGPDLVLGRVHIGGCWCEPSYFNSTGPQLVSSGGNTLQLWSVVGSTTQALVPGPSTIIQNGQDGGFFTTVSSNGAANPIIWAVSRPTDNSPANVLLYAFAAQPVAGSATLRQLFVRVAGHWPNTGGNANIVPVVANGLVYVASNGLLAIFGIGGK
jgi:hypothetical protein